jgi:hypothetical protein
MVVPEATAAGGEEGKTEWTEGQTCWFCPGGIEASGGDYTGFCLEEIQSLVDISGLTLKVTSPLGLRCGPKAKRRARGKKCSQCTVLWVTLTSAHPTL